MRGTSLGAAVALLIVGCGIDRDPTGPEDPGLTFPDPVTVPEPEFAAAAVATNVWATKAAMPTPRANFAAAVVNGLLYTVGGSDAGGTNRSTVEAYSPGSNSWTSKAPLPSARGFPSGAGTINGVLYVAGGKNLDGAPTDTLFAYAPSTNTWSTKARMLLPGSGGAGGVIGGKLYVYSGGSDVLRPSFQRYDPATNSWKILAAPALRPATPTTRGPIAGPAGPPCRSAGR
jgi:N-acetylneuraminic acid mutarotase